MAKHLYEFQMVSGNPGHPVCLRSSWELQCSICDMILSCYKRDFIFNMRISGEKFETLFIQDIFYNIFQIFCISLHKADSIMDIVVQLSDVSHVPLFNYLQWRSDVCVTDFKWCRSQGSVNNNVTLIKKRLEGMFIIVHFFTVIICDVDLSYKIRL